MLATEHALRHSESRDKLQTAIADYAKTATPRQWWFYVFCEACGPTSVRKIGPTRVSSLGPTCVSRFGPASVSRFGSAFALPPSPSGLRRTGRDYGGRADERQRDGPTRFKHPRS